MTYLHIKFCNPVLNLDAADDFFRDLQTEFRNLEANADSQGKPKSLWEELAVSTLHSFDN
jgi:hypothetical protein